MHFTVQRPTRVATHSSIYHCRWSNRESSTLSRVCTLSCRGLCTIVRSLSNTNSWEPVDLSPWTAFPPTGRIYLSLSRSTHTPTNNMNVVTTHDFGAREHPTYNPNTIVLFVAWGIDRKHWPEKEKMDAGGGVAMARVQNPIEQASRGAGARWLCGYNFAFDSAEYFETRHSVNGVAGEGSKASPRAAALHYKEAHTLFNLPALEREGERICR